MTKLKRAELAGQAHRINLEQLARLGGELRAARLRRRLTQTELGRIAGLARSTVSDLERGRGGGHTLDTWQRLALAVDRPLRVELRRDSREEPADAGHLAIQELILRLGRRGGIRAGSSCRAGCRIRAARPMSASATIDAGS